jgi:hypothetical protein
MDKILGIDLSLRSTGLFIDGKYKLIQADPKKINEEALLVYNAKSILDFIKETKPDYVNLEGLSLGSVSSSMDIICGNFWYLRTEIFKAYPFLPVNIIPVKTWRCPLFSKADNKIFMENGKKLKALKKELEYEKMNYQGKRDFAKENSQLILDSNVKYLTFLKLPIEWQDEFHQVSFTNGCFDLVDAYWISKHSV